MVRTSGRHHRSGITLVELLVVLGIVGLLASLTLPAVQAAREAARSIRCQSNLREIGVAMHSYHEVFGVFPAYTGMPNIIYNSLLYTRREYSVFTFISSQLGHHSIYHSINFDVATYDPYLFPFPRRRGEEANTTVMAAKLDILFCPSDPGGGDPGWTGGVNYRVNIGRERSTWVRAEDGPLSGPKTYASIAAIQDGTSNTVAISEKLRGASSATALNARTGMIDGWQHVLPPFTIDEAASNCSRLASPPSRSFPAGGLTWFVGALSQTCYNHINRPNGPNVDCVAKTSPVSGIVGARSNHPGCVHCLMCGGSVRKVVSGVDLAVWRGLGSRSGGEIIPSLD